MAVVSVTEDQVQDQAGNLSDVFVITFTIANHPGTFSVTVPQSGDPIAAANDAISAKTSEVGGIYGL